MKRLKVIFCIMCMGIAACAPQQPAPLTPQESVALAAPRQQISGDNPALEKIETFMEEIPDEEAPALYQMQGTDLQIPPLSERPPQAQTPPPEPADQGVGLNFENADIHDVTKIVSEITGENFVVDSDVQGTVTIYSERPLSPDQVFELFKSVLELNDLALTRVGDIYKIVPSEKAQKRYLAVDSTRRPTTDDLVTQIVKLRYVKAKDVKAALETLTESEIVVYPDEDGNTLIITDLASNVRKLQEIIAQMDVSQYANRYIEIFPIQHADLEDLVQDLNQILAIPGAAGDLAQMAAPTPQADQQPTPEAPTEAEPSATPVVPPGTATNLYAIERLNALMVSSNNPDVITLVGKWIQILDQPSAGDPVVEELAPNERTNFVYPVKYSKAKDLAPILVRVYEDVSQAQQADQQADQQQPVNPQDTDSEEQAPVFIEDTSTNSLIIRATPTQYTQILDLLEQLDQRPPQVLIDVIIAEVTLSDNDVFGVKGMLQSQDQLTIGGETNTFTGVAETAFDGISGGSGFNYMLNAPGRFLMQLKALAAEGRVKVLSDPHILVQNNQEANINIGDNIPITKTTGEGDTAETTVEYQQTGIILTVTPQINLDGDVVMDIEQKVSSPGTKESGEVAPPINETRAKTQLITQDGQPLVIGGLISSKASTTRQGVPLLKDIPLLGRLFRYKDTQNNRKELVILVLPRIIRSPEQGWNLTDDVLQKRVKELEELFNREQTDADRVKQFFRRQFVPDEE